MPYIGKAGDIQPDLLPGASKLCRFGRSGHATGLTATVRLRRRRTIATACSAFCPSPLAAHRRTL
jgi:hypothetical protein